MNTTGHSLTVKISLFKSNLVDTITYLIMNLPDITTFQPTMPLFCNPVQRIRLANLVLLKFRCSLTLKEMLDGASLLIFWE